jgi:hypothetical protein
MWRHVSLVDPYFAQASSPQQRSEAIEHGHSPRHTTSLARATAPAPKIGSMLPPAVQTFPGQLNFDPFTEPVYAAFRGWRQPSSDVSMPDYSDPSTRANTSRNVSDPMQISQSLDRQFESIHQSGGYDALCEALMPSAPVNTPQNEAASPTVDEVVPKPSITITPQPITSRWKTSSQLCTTADCVHQ